MIREGYERRFCIFFSSVRKYFISNYETLLDHELVQVGPSDATDIKDFIMLLSNNRYQPFCIFLWPELSHIWKILTQDNVMSLQWPDINKYLSVK